ncbi:aminodeoxychorismate synthase, component I, partial [Prosthecomicrobium hirschii]
MRILDIGLTDPVAAALSLAGLPGLCVLESAMRDPALGRFSSVAADPFGVFTVVGGTAFWNGVALEGDPLEALGARLALYPQGTVPGPGPFQGGAAGYLG